MQKLLNYRVKLYTKTFQHLQIMYYRLNLSLTICSSINSEQNGFQLECQHYVKSDIADVEIHNVKYIAMQMFERNFMYV